MKYSQANTWCETETERETGTREAAMLPPIPARCHSKTFGVLMSKPFRDLMPCYKLNILERCFLHFFLPDNVGHTRQKNSVAGTSHMMDDVHGRR